METNFAHGIWPTWCLTAGYGSQVPALMACLARHGHTPHEREHKLITLLSWGLHKKVHRYLVLHPMEFASTGCSDHSVLVVAVQWARVKRKPKEKIIGTFVNEKHKLHL
eukprot:6486825-Amphidinium_carterae.1